MNELLDLLKKLNFFDLFCLRWKARALYFKHHPRMVAFYATVTAGFLVIPILPLLGKVLLK